MTQATDVVVILGSGPNAVEARDWPRDSFDRLVVINNAWRVRPDWDDLVYPEDFPIDRRPGRLHAGQRLIDADQFVPTQNAYGGVVYVGGTMAFTCAYWVLHALRPKVMAFLGCDMVYPRSGPTHFYGTGAPDPLRADVTLQDLGAKSARLGLLAAEQGCRCVNLSGDKSALVFPRAGLDDLRSLTPGVPAPEVYADILRREDELGYLVPSGRYWGLQDQFDADALADLDARWRAAWAQAQQAAAAA